MSEKTKPQTDPNKDTKPTDPSEVKPTQDDALQIVQTPENPNDDLPEMQDLEKLRLAAEAGKPLEEALKGELPSDTDPDKGVDKGEKGALPAEPKPGEQAEPGEGGDLKEGDEGKSEQEKLQAELDRVKGELRRRDGRYGSEKQQLLARIEILEQDLQRAVSAIPAREPAKKPEESTIVAPEKMADPTDEDLKAYYGDDFEEFMGRDYAVRLYKANQIAAARREQEIVSAIEQKVRAHLDGMQAQSTLDQAIAEIEKDVPGIRELDENASVNGFAAYLDEEAGETGFTRREVAARAIQTIQTSRDSSAISRAKSTLKGIYAGFPIGGEGEEKDPAPGEGNEGATRKPKPDPRSLVMPSTSKADRKPADAGSTMTLDQADAALRQAEKDGNLDKVMARLFDMTAKNQIIS